MIGCDHKFVDTNVCLKCGVHIEVLRAASRERVAILGGLAWHDQQSVRAEVKKLTQGTVVLIDDDPFDTQAAALRQCRCSSLVCLQHRLPASTARRAVESRRERDLVMLTGASRAIVFGDIAPDRERTLKDCALGGLTVERRR